MYKEMALNKPPNSLEKFQNYWLPLIVIIVYFVTISSEGTRDFDVAENRPSAAATIKSDNDNLYTCEWSYFEFDESMIAFNINHLSLIDRNNQTEVQEINETATEGYGSIEAKNFALSEIDFNLSPEQLAAGGLNPRLPFKIFINGFNTLDENGDINGTWMYDVAKAFAKRGLQNRRNQKEPEVEENILFLTWGIPRIYAHSVFAMIPAYFKTMANYDITMRFVADTILKMIDFVDDSIDLEGGWPDEAARAKYFSQFEFYGHSLGSHIMTDAINRVRKAHNNRPMKLGKLIGLDPAMPCFLSGLGHRLVGDDKLSYTTVESVIIHSNAGLVGLATERVNREIVLNGGTFQPGCSWYDLSCHHQRATDIFGYLDDQCQMVAYKCSSYHHFKSGACETCDFDPTNPPSKSYQSASRQSDTYGENCVLVNMNHQHVDTDQTLNFVNRIDKDRIRQLADENEDYTNWSAIFEAAKTQRAPSVRRYSSTTPLAQGKMFARATNIDQNRDREQNRTYYHFVNTSPNFRVGRKTHCLQHYQVRLIVLQNGEDNLAEEACPIGSFLTTRGDDISLRLFYDDSILSKLYKNGVNSDDIGGKLKRQIATERASVSSPSITLSKIIKNNLYTSLLNFEGSPELFIGAKLENIDLQRLNDCLAFSSDKVSANFKFVLDMAFMSHTNRRFRQAFSSILCGSVFANNSSNPMANASLTTDNEQDKNQILLKLCKKSDLTSVSSRIDKMLDQIEQERINESWRASLLNSLFSLFAEW